MRKMDGLFRRGEVLIHKVSQNFMVVLDWNPKHPTLIECRYFNSVTGEYPSRVFFVEEFIPKREIKIKM
jgi:hypothetical protein